MKKNKKLILGLFLATAVAAGCAGPAQTAKQTAPAAPAATAGLSGKVAETMDGGGYTYIALEKEGKKTWVAIPTTKVTVGQELKLMPGAEMTNFPSKALNRTFDKIIFSGGMETAKAAEASTAGMKAAAAAPQKVELVLAGKVVETMDAGTYTYIRLEKDGKSGWSAVPNAHVAVGDEVEILPGTEMGRFTSKSLNRTFDNIYFASGVKQGDKAAPAAKEGAAAPAAKAEAKEAAAAPALPAGHPKIDAAAAKAETASAAAAAPVGALLGGKVVETSNAGGYTYICVEKDGKKVWAAVPPTDVKVGQEVKIQPGVEMTNFVSKSLNRTFEKITFSNGLAQ